MTQNNSIPKYPRTPHLAGSLKTDGDNLEDITIDLLYGKYTVITEKVDGSNVGIYFTDRKDIEIRHRNHIVHGDEYSQLLQWSWSNYDMLWKLLGNNFVLYGEWLYYEHTIYYDMLPSYFLAFDIYDRSSDIFLSTARFGEMLKSHANFTDISTVRIISTGECTQEWISFLLEDDYSRYRSGREPMEGVYIKVEDENQVLLRCKYVNHLFADAIGNVHWKNKKPVKNELTSK